MRGILFDLDGTLVDSERETAEAMARAIERGHGIAIEPYDRDFIIGRSWAAGARAARRSARGSSTAGSARRRAAGRTRSTAAGASR